jgi:hypothetical protein
MNVQPQKSGEEVEPFLHRPCRLCLFESYAVCRKSFDDIGIVIRKVDIRIRMEERVEWSFSRTRHSSRKDKLQEGYKLSGSDDCEQLQKAVQGRR